MADKVLTGALAIVKVNGTPIGRMRTVTATENLRRQPVRGIGTILVQESPVVEHAGTLNAQFYEVDFQKTGIPKAINREVQTKQEFEDNVLLNHDGVQVDIFKKITDYVDTNTGKIIPKAIPHAIITRVLIEQENIDISEGQVSGHNQNFTYLDPIIKPS
jgi:hypothetical protein